MFPKWIWLLFIAPAVFVALVLWCNWSEIKTNFYALTLADALDLYATVVFGVILATLVTDRMGRRQRQLELRCGMLDRTESIAALVWNAFEQYSDDPSGVNRQRLLLHFKECSRFIDVLRTTLRSEPTARCGDLVKAFHALKSAATDDGADVLAHSEQWKSRAHDRYCSLVNAVWLQKAQLFQKS